MMMQSRVVVSNNPDMLQEKVNQELVELSGKEIIDIKLTSTVYNQEIFYTVLIMFNV